MNTNPSLPLHWAALVRRFLLGTDQLPPDESLRDYLALLSIDTDEDAPALLEAIGITQLLLKGTQPLVIQAPPPPALASDAEQPCSPYRLQLLQLMLNGHHAPALPELVALLRQSGQILPPESLPELLDKCLLQPALWPSVSAAMGQRGTWLARQHPQWAQLLPDPTALPNWPTAPPEQQPDRLRQYRQSHPAAARRSLEDAWPQLEKNAAPRLLSALTVNLHADDEPFLETCLTDKRKPVRLVAADLLARLPDSALVGRLWLYAQAVMQCQQGKWTWTLPDAPPEATVADGIVPTGSKLPGGLSLNWLQQLLGRIPLYFWEGHWDIPAAELITSNTAHPDALLLQRAFVESLLRYPHPAAATALYKWWLLAGQTNYWDNAPAKQLLAQATADQFNTCLLGWLEKHGPLVPPDTLAAWWLAEGQHPWSNALAKVVVLGFQDTVQAFRAADWQLFHYRRLLEAAAYRSDPALLDTFKYGWSFRGPAARWQPDVEKLLHTLHFRREMQKG